MKDRTRAQKKRIAEYSARHGVAAAAAHYGLSKTTVVNYRNMFGISREQTNLTEDQRREIAVYSQGHSIPEAMKRFGVTRSMVARCRSEFNMPKLSPGRPSRWSGDNPKVMGCLSPFIETGHHLYCARKEIANDGRRLGVDRASVIHHVTSRTVVSAMIEFCGKRG